jgi:hypothetical protein
VGRGPRHHGLARGDTETNTIQLDDDGDGTIDRTVVDVFPL